MPATQSISNMTAERLPALCERARNRGRNATKETIGRHLKCKFCESPDACIQKTDNRLMIFCPVCCQQYFLKEYRYSPDISDVVKVIDKI